MPSLRLTDFGIALALGEPRLTQQGTIVGTPGYLAPEILAGALPSIQQDLYAAGITALQLLTGQEPSAGPHPHNQHRPLGLPGATSTAIWDVIEFLLHPDPNKRADSATTGLAHLKPALAEPLQIPAHTPDNDLIEVFDHLPPLPTRAVTTLPTPTARREGPGPAARPPTDQATNSRADGQAADTHSAAGQRPSGESPNGEKAGGATDGRRRRVLMTAGAGLAVAAVATTAVLLIQGEPGNNLRPTGGSTTSTTSPTTAPSSQPTPSPTPPRDPTPPPVSTGSPNPNPDPEVTLGGPCGWQEAGTLETAANGIRVECRKQGSAYRWVRAT